MYGFKLMQTCLHFNASFELKFYENSNPIFIMENIFLKLSIFWNVMLANVKGLPYLMKICIIL